MASQETTIVPKTDKRSFSARNLLKIIFLLILLWYLFASGKIDLHKIASSIKGDNLPVFVLLGVLFFISLMIFSIRQRLLINHLGGRLDYLLSLKIFLVTTFFNNFLPGATGGDFVRMYYLKRYTGIRYAELGSFTILDRVLGVSGLAAIVYIDLIILSLSGVGEAGSVLQPGKRFIWGLSLIPLAVMGSFLLLRINRFYEFLIKITGRIMFKQQIHSFISGLTVYARRRRLLLASLGLSLVSHFISILAISLLASQLFGQSAFVGSLLLSPLVIITAIVPVTPGNIGWTETMAETIWNLFGIQGGATTFVLWRLICALVSLAGGFVYLSLGKMKNSKTL